MSIISRRAVLSGLAASSVLPGLGYGQERTTMKVRVAFAGEDFVVTLEDHASALEFASMLPLSMTISDYANNEKIAYLPRKLTALVRGPLPDAGPGDLCYYVPWGNLAFFHGPYESTRDLVRLGRLDGGVTPLLTKGEFPLRIEVAR